VTLSLHFTPFFVFVEISLLKVLLSFFSCMFKFFSCRGLTYYLPLLKPLTTSPSCKSPLTPPCTPVSFHPKPHPYGVPTTHPPPLLRNSMEAKVAYSLGIYLPYLFLEKFKNLFFFSWNCFSPLYPSFQSPPPFCTPIFPNWTCCS